MSSILKKIKFNRIITNIETKTKYTEKVSLIKSIIKIENYPISYENIIDKNSSKILFTINMNLLTNKQISFIDGYLSKCKFNQII